MKKIYLIILFMLNLNSINFIIPEIRSEKMDFSIAVIIPCYHGHFQFLENLLTEYTKQTKLPDEIVISISEVNKIPKAEIEKFEALTWPFKVKILTTNKQLFAGQNRNKALLNADAEIIVCQDADDTPHPQRIEIIKYAFDNFKITYLMHLTSRDARMLNDKYHLEDNPINNQTMFDLSSIKTELDGCHGTISAKKNMLLKLKWSDAPFREDVLFTDKLTKNRKKYFIIKNPLYFVDGNNSSHNYKINMIKKIERKIYDN